MSKTAPAARRFSLSVVSSTLTICVALIAARVVSAQPYRDHSRASIDGGLLAIAQPRHHAVVLFDARPAVPQPLFAFGRYGRQAGEFVRPTGVALDARRERIYVSDSDNDRIQAFDLSGDANGKLTGARFAKAIGRTGSAPGELRRPAGLALDGEHNLYVCDGGNARVQVFDATLTFVRQWGTAGGGPGQFRNPSSVAVDATTVYVSDTERPDVQGFDRGARWQTAWGTPRHADAGLAAGELAFPFGLALADGSVYVSDARRQDVQQFRGSTLIRVWGRPGSADGQFFQPEGIAVVDAGRVFVIDQGGHRGQLFSHEGRFIAAFTIPAGDLYPWATPASN